MSRGISPSRLSHAHERPELRADNPLYERTGSARAAFEARRVREENEGAARRESFMVQRQQPRPVLRPSPRLAFGPDGAAFDVQWEAERRQAARQARRVEQHFSEGSERAARREAFMAERQQPGPARMSPDLAYGSARAAFDASLEEADGPPRQRGQTDQHITREGRRTTMDNDPPRDVLRDGNLKASIWRNDGEKGPFYSTRLTRTYKDQQGELRDTHSFVGTELLRVSELARKAYDLTQALRREDREQQPPHEPQREGTERQGTQQAPARDEPATDPAKEQRRQAFQQQRQPQSDPAREPAHQIPERQNSQSAPAPEIAAADPAREQRRQAFQEQRQPEPEPPRQPDRQR